MSYPYADDDPAEPTGPVLEPAEADEPAWRTDEHGEPLRPATSAESAAESGQEEPPGEAEI